MCALFRGQTSIAYNDDVCCSDVMKARRNTRQTHENYSVMTMTTVSHYVIVFLLLGNMTLLHTLPPVTLELFSYLLNLIFS